MGFFLNVLDAKFEWYEESFLDYLLPIGRVLALLSRDKTFISRGIYIGLPCPNHRSFLSSLAITLLSFFISRILVLIPFLWSNVGLSPYTFNLTIPVQLSLGYFLTTPFPMQKKFMSARWLNLNLSVVERSKP